MEAPASFVSESIPHMGTASDRLRSRRARPLSLAENFPKALDGAAKAAEAFA